MREQVQSHGTDTLFQIYAMCENHMPPFLMEARRDVPVRLGGGVTTHLTRARVRLTQTHLTRNHERVITARTRCNAAPGTRFERRLVD